MVGTLLVTLTSYSYMLSHEVVIRRNHLWSMWFISVNKYSCRHEVQLLLVLAAAGGAQRGARARQFSSPLLLLNEKTGTLRSLPVQVQLLLVLAAAIYDINNTKNASEDLAEHCYKIMTFVKCQV
ncbi:hypothetical protein JEQ12_006575 [Ovis aries]|uniref:Uncharacterized protein n=1 Tax=Ovis aries TaxID=9940 RepID=A0A836CYI6_SHEEP|nr:hypothetical protein JEQ12_006575 [Ovis aries]